MDMDIFCHLPGFAMVCCVVEAIDLMQQHRCSAYFAVCLPRAQFFVVYVEVRDSPHGIFGSCTRYPRGLTRCSELLGRRRRRRRHLEIQVDIQARELYLEFVPMDLDSDETSRDIDTAVLHRISIPFIWAEWVCLRAHF